MFEKITSPANEKIKRVVRLRDKKERDKTGLTIVEGEREILRALEAGVEIVELYHCGKLKEEGIRLIKESEEKGKFLVLETNPAVFGKIAYGERQEGILAVARITKKVLNDVTLGNPPFVLVLEGVEKPGNLGGILRSCDAAGIDAVILSESKTDVYNPNTIRASLGAVFSVPVVLSHNEETLHFLKKHAITSLATSPDAEALYTAADLTQALAIIMGSEDRGLSDFWLKAADGKTLIPMQGTVDSLNVSTSTAIILYEAIRQRSAK